MERDPFGPTVAWVMGRRMGPVIEDEYNNATIAVVVVVVPGSREYGVYT